MRSRHIYIAGSVLLVALLLLQFSFWKVHTYPVLDRQVSEEMQEMYDAFAFDQLKKANPETGLLPSEALWSAYLELRSRGFYTNEMGGTRSDDGWNRVNDFFPSLAVTKITYDQNNTNIFYFCTGEGWYNADAVRGAGVFKSTDAGETWERLESTNNSLFQYCQDVDVHPITGDVYVATRTGGLQRSTDGGLTWQKVLGTTAGSARNSICDVEITSDGGVFVGIGIFETDGIYYSDNGDSSTYSKQTVGLPAGGFYRVELAVAKSDPDIAYAIPCSTNYAIAGIYRTDDRGTTWQATALPEDTNTLAANQAWYDLVIEVDPNDPNVIIAGGLNLWRSKDGGGTWQQLTSGRLDSNLIRYVHVDQHAVLFRNSEEVYFGNDGGIYKTMDFTSDQPFIYPRNDGYNVTQYYSAAMSYEPGDYRIIGGTQDNGSHLAHNPGLSSFKPVSGADGAFTAVNSSNPDIFYTATQYKRLFRFDNGGFELPDTITNPYVDNNNVLFINPFEIDPVNPENLYMASNTSLWRLNNASTADTADWEKACAYSGTISAISVSTNPPDLVFIGRNTSNSEPAILYNASVIDNTSTPIGLDPNGDIPDGGAFSSSRYCSSIAVDVVDANHLLVSYSNYGIPSLWETNNALSGSPIWTNVEGDLPDVPVNWAALHPGNPNVAYIATELGVFFTNQMNGEETIWQPCSTFPVVRTDMLRIRTADGVMIAATHGRGIWEAQIDPEGISNDITWIERGPNNVGGRTRALMIDPNDPSGQTVWAGSIAGGLWKTSNIDGLTSIESPNQQLEIQAFPNPVYGSEIVADLQVFRHSKVKVQLIQISSGQALQAHHMNIGGSGLTPISIDRNRVPAGSYLLVIEGGNRKAVTKLVIL